MFTRQHYKAIAKIIRDNTYRDAGNLRTTYVEVLIEKLANYFKADNPRFDRKRFLDACNES